MLARHCETKWCGMTDGELLAIEQRLMIWRAGINALGSDAFNEDRQRATDQGKLIAEVFRLRGEQKAKPNSSERSKP